MVEIINGCQVTTKKGMITGIIPLGIHLAENKNEALIKEYENTILAWPEVIPRVLPIIDRLKNDL